VVGMNSRSVSRMANTVLECTMIAGVRD